MCDGGIVMLPLLLLTLHQRRVTGLQEPPRVAGSVIVHDNTIPHGVTPVTQGVRYGLFLINER